jgi:hypothetical protein
MIRQLWFDPVIGPTGTLTQAAFPHQAVERLGRFGLVEGALVSIASEEKKPTPR